MLHDSISHFVGPLVGPSVRWSLTKSFLRLFIVFLLALNGEKKLGGVKSLLKSAFEKKFLSVCLPDIF